MSDPDKFDAEPSLWIPMSNPVSLAIIGKLGEEAAELAAICSRIVIQGIDGVNPENLKTNIDALTEEIADVAAMSLHALDRFHLSPHHIDGRREKKYAHKERWHNMLKQALGVK